MNPISTTWQRLPVVVRATVTGFVVALIGQLPRNPLFFANLRLSPRFPWSVVVIAVYLWLMWRYLGGAWEPAATAQVRRERLRGQLPPRHLRWRALLAGIVISVALRAFLDIVRRLSTRPTQDLEFLQRVGSYPRFTILLMFLTTAAIAGIVEEAAFRGYIQQPIEKRHGPKFAIIFTAMLFCLAHYRPEAVDLWPWLIFTPAYFAVGVALGTLAYLTNSIVIGILCHAVVDAAAFLRYWSWGVPNSVWVVGVDRNFWIESSLLVIFGVLSFWVLSWLASARPQIRI